MNIVTKKQDSIHRTGTTDKRQTDSIAQELLVTGPPEKPISNIKSNESMKLYFC
jgi:hypothetical protein